MPDKDWPYEAEQSGETGEFHLPQNATVRFLQNLNRQLLLHKIIFLPLIYILQVQEGLLWGWSSAYLVVPCAKVARTCHTTPVQILSILSVPVPACLD
jgi:hypothetical protein